MLCVADIGSLGRVPLWLNGYYWICSAGLDTLWRPCVVLGSLAVVEALHHSMTGMARVYAVCVRGRGGDSSLV